MSHRTKVDLFNQILDMQEELIRCRIDWAEMHRLRAQLQETETERDVLREEHAQMAQRLLDRSQPVDLSGVHKPWPPVKPLTTPQSET